MVGSGCLLLDSGQRLTTIVVLLHRFRGGLRGETATGLLHRGEGGALLLLLVLHIVHHITHLAVVLDILLDASLVVVVGLIVAWSLVARSLVTGSLMAWSLVAGSLVTWSLRLVALVLHNGPVRQPLDRGDHLDIGLGILHRIGDDLAGLGHQVLDMLLVFGRGLVHVHIALVLLVVLLGLDIPGAVALLAALREALLLALQLLLSLDLLLAYLLLLSLELLLVALLLLTSLILPLPLMQLLGLRLRLLLAIQQVARLIAAILHGRG